MKLIRTISVLSFCLLILFSGSSFVVNMHLCGGHVRDIALFQEAKKCINKKEAPACHQQASKPCCEDHTIVHESEDLKSNVSKLQISSFPVLDIDQPFVLIAEVIPAEPVSRKKYYNYDPPLRSSDLTIRHQVFLI